MLESFLADIYEKALALDLVKKVSFFANLKNPYKCHALWNEASTNLNKILDDLNETNPHKKVELFNSIISARDNFTDLHKFSGIIDTCIIPKLVDYLNCFTGINVTENEWTFESSSIGFLTIRKTDGLYIHSVSDPMWESFIYAYDIYKPEVRRYDIFGGGLGYVAYQLWRLSDKEADIYVYEIDDRMCDYADLYGVNSLIDNGKLHIRSGNDKEVIVEEFLDRLTEPDSFSFIYFLDEGYDGVFADQLYLIRSILNTEKLFDDKWKKNYLSNTLLPHASIDSLDITKLHNEWVIVAAGPSLNDNSDFIKESVGCRTICTVNTSLRWFSNIGIKPDLCVACDPLDGMIPHIEGLEDYSADIPLIADYVTNGKYVDLYKGKRFYVYTSSSYKLSPEQVDEKEVWSIGGTVTSMAIEAAFRLGAKKIFLVGADLGYPEGKTYAENVSKANKQWNKDEKYVVSVDNKMIPTSVQFYEYKQQIENQIRRHPDIKVINRSLHGAYLDGSYCGMWWENLLENDSIEGFNDGFEELKKDSLMLGWREKYYIFQQAFFGLKNQKIIVDEQEEKVIESAYKTIFDAFMNEINIPQVHDVRADNDLTYIFTTEFGDETDEHTKNVLKIAKSEAIRNKKILIINTTEKLGGKPVPIIGAISSQYNKSMENAENVSFENRSFSYFQFTDGMPNIDQYKVFLESMTRKCPGKIIITSQYSLLADCCAPMYDIKVERKLNNE